MNLLDVFKWSEGEVISKFSEAIGEQPTLMDENNNYAFWDRNSPYVVQAHIDVVEDRFNKGKWDKDKREYITDPKKEIEPPKILRIRNLIGRLNGILGGDDRAGIMAILHINKTCTEKGNEINPPSILLTNHEESGGKGMEVFIDRVCKDFPKLLDPVRMILALDRRGVSEFVYYSTAMPKEVLNYIESFGFNKSHGSWSDSKKLTSKFKMPHVNLSVGYYDNHSDRETVHIDECLLTAKRVCAMCKEPIAQRYEIEEKVVNYGSGAYGSYESGDYGYGSRSNSKSGDALDKKIAANEKRRKRCDSMRTQSNLPFRCTYFPYLDYLLTDAFIRDDFHIVSSPNYGKTLEEWYYLFDVKSCKDDVAALWQKEFGSMKKIYVKATSARMFYLAVQYSGDAQKFAKYNAECAEREESRIIAKRCRETQDKLKEIEAERKAKDDAEKQVAADVEKQIEAEHGYCIRYSVGECTGDCHGDRAGCNFPEGPDESLAGAHLDRIC